MSNLSKERKLSLYIIDLVEELVRKQYPEIDKIARLQKGNTLLKGEAYYTLENEITNKIKEMYGNGRE